MLESMHHFIPRKMCDRTKGLTVTALHPKIAPASTADAKKSGDANSSAADNQSASPGHREAGKARDNKHHKAGAESASPEPRAYDPEFAHIAEIICMHGGSDVLALAFKVDEATIRDWQRQHPEFRDACKQGNDFANECILRSLFQLARGYEYWDVKIFRRHGRPIYAPFLKHVPGDVEAAKFWLVNRLPEEWGYKADAKPEVKPGSPTAHWMSDLKFETLKPVENPPRRKENDL